MGTFTKGDIVLFRFPYTNLTQRKLRPCLVISDEMREDILLCQITSKNTPYDNYTIELKQTDTQNGNLKIDSYIRTNMIFTAAKDQIFKKIGQTKENIYAAVTNEITKIITKKN